MKAQDTKNNVAVTILGQNAGWFQVKNEAGDAYKLRLKDLNAEGGPEAITAAFEPKADGAAKTPATKAKMSSGQKAKRATEDKAARKKPGTKKGSKKGADGRLIPADLERYVRGKGTTESGRDTLDIDDETAQKLRGMDVEAAASEVGSLLVKVAGKDDKLPNVRSIVKQCEKKGIRIKLDDADAAGRALVRLYEGLNRGMIRMNLGNRYRGLLNEWKALKG